MNPFNLRESALESGFEFFDAGASFWTFKRVNKFKEVQWWDFGVKKSLKEVKTEVKISKLRYMTVKNTEQR